MLKENNQHVRFRNINKTFEQILFGFSAKSDVWKVTKTLSWAPGLWIDSNRQGQLLSVQSAPCGVITYQLYVSLCDNKKSFKTTGWKKRSSCLSFQQRYVVEKWAVVVFQQLPSVKVFLPFTHVHVFFQIIESPLSSFTSVRHIGMLCCCCISV